MPCRISYARSRHYRISGNIVQHLCNAQTERKCRFVIFIVLFRTFIMKIQMKSIILHTRHMHITRKAYEARLPAISFHSMLTLSLYPYIMDYTLYKCSLATALVLMLFFAVYFLAARTPGKPIYANYMRSRRTMGAALMALSANYAVHLFGGLRFHDQSAAILMNLSTYFLSYWLFSSALTTLLDHFYITRRRCACHLLHWAAFTAISASMYLLMPKGTLQYTGLAIMALWLLCYGIYLSRRLIMTYHRAVRLFDDTHSEHIAAYIRWMSIFTWWALIYGVSCGLLTFLPDEYMFLWILSSIPFYIYLYCSYMNYLLFYEQVESILEKEAAHQSSSKDASTGAQTGDAPGYHALIEKNLKVWLATDGYTTPGLTIEDLATALGTNRTYLSAYINSRFHVSFREWMADHRIKFAKRMLVSKPKMNVSEVSEASGFLSLSYFTKIFTEKEGLSPSKWRKTKLT